MPYSNADPRGSWGKRLARDQAGAVIIEAALGLVMLIVVLVGIVTYGFWFMAAHSLQQVANEAARATLGAMDTSERDELVQRSIDNSIAQTGAIDARLLHVDTDTNEGFYTVTLTYDASNFPLFESSLIPLPSDTIRRSASIEVTNP